MKPFMPFKEGQTLVAIKDSGVSNAVRKGQFLRMMGPEYQDSENYVEVELFLDNTCTGVKGFSQGIHISELATLNSPAGKRTLKWKEPQSNG